MRKASVEELNKRGWQWGLRHEGLWMAVSISPFDAATWVKERIGEVVDLQTGRVHTGEDHE